SGRSRSSPRRSDSPTGLLAECGRPAFFRCCPGKDCYVWVISQTQAGKGRRRETLFQASNEKRREQMRIAAFILTVVLLDMTPFLQGGDKKGEPKELFNGTDLKGWKLRPGPDAKNSKWKVVAGVSLDKKDPGRLDFKEGTGALLNGDNGRGVDLL